MSDFDPRTATLEEFEAEARRTHAEVVARFDAMTDEERAAWDQFAMPGYERRLKELKLNQISSVEGLETNIATCVEHYRRVNRQESPEYEAELARRVEADRRRAQEERQRQVREEVERRNAEAAERSKAEREEREAERRERDEAERARRRQTAERQREAERRAHAQRQEEAEEAARREREAEDPVVREIRVLMAQNDPSRFTKSGKPRCSVLTLLVGRRVSATERNSAWAAYKQSA